MDVFSDKIFKGNRSQAIEYLLKTAFLNTPKELFDFTVVDDKVPYKLLLRGELGKQPPVTVNINVAIGFRKYVNTLREEYNTTVANILQLSLIMYLSSLMDKSPTLNTFKNNLNTAPSPQWLADAQVAVITYTLEQPLYDITELICKEFGLKRATLMKNIAYIAVPLLEEHIRVNGSITKEQVLKSYKTVSKLSSSM